MNSAAGDDVGEVVVGVAGGGEDGDGEAAELQDVAVPDALPLELHRLVGGDEVGHPQRAGEVEATGDVVVVDVGLEDVGQSDPVGIEDLQHPVDVALRVDDQGGAAVADDVAAVPQRGRLDRHDLKHGPS